MLVVRGYARRRLVGYQAAGGRTHGVFYCVANVDRMCSYGAFADNNPQK